MKRIEQYKKWIIAFVFAVAVTLVYKVSGKTFKVQ